LKRLRLRRNKTMKRIADITLIALFLAVIGVPMIDMIFRIDQTRNTEQRTLAPAPSLDFTSGGALLASAKALPGKFKAWTGDHFGLRNLMIRLHGIMKVKGLGVSSSDQVVLGKHEYDAAGRDQGQWLYYAAHGTMEYHLARRPFKADELEQWRKVLEARRDWLASRGCRYVFVIAPNSQSIYPEFLPDAWRRVGTKSRADELIEYLRKTSAIEVVDTREWLMDFRMQRPDLRLYHRTDTHWNDLGSFVAYRQIVGHLKMVLPSDPRVASRWDAARWAQHMSTLSWDQFDIVTRETEGGDLAGVLGIKDLYREQRIELAPKPPLKLLIQREQHQMGRLVTEKPDAGLPRLVMFRDSFGETVMPFLAEHFSRGVFIWTDQFQREDVEEHNPDLVITQMVERLLWRKPPQR
jgi:hypothetical protein